MLESILWCLFGHEAARTSKELLKRQDAAPGEDVVVRLEFEADQHRYAVTRRLKGKSLQPEASVEADGQLLVSPGANSWDQANRCVERLLGFDRSSFESTVVAKQGELAALSELRPAQRKRLLLEMLGIERIEAAIQVCRGDARLLEARLQEARRALEREPAVQQRLTQARAELEQAHARLADVVSRLEAAVQRAAEDQARGERLLEARIRDQELRARLQGLQTRLEAVWTQRSRIAAEAQILRERQAEAERLAVDLRAFEGLDEELRAFEHAQQAAEERGRLETQVARLESELGRWEGVLQARPRNGSSPQSLETKLAGFVAASAKAIEDQARMQAERVRCEHELEQLVATPVEHGPHGLAPDDACPVCERPLGDRLQALKNRQESQAAARAERTSQLRSLLVELQAELAAHARRRTDAERDVEECCRQLESARQKLRESDLAQREIQRIQAALLESREAQASIPAPPDAALGQTLAARRTERDRIRERALRAEEAARRLPRLRDEERVLQAEEAQIVREREEASRELGHLAYPAGAWEKARTAAEASRRDVQSLERDQVQWRERVTAWERESKDLETQAAELGQVRERVEAEIVRLKVLETIAGARGEQGVLPEFKAHLVGRVRPALAIAAASLIRQMTEGRYSELLLDEDYGVHLYDGAVAHPMERFSGGERDIANLGIRLAVSELVANARGRSRLQFVALDEVFGSQDGERREAVMRCLAGLSNVFRQVFVVTHLDEVRDRLDHILRVDEAADGSGRIEVVA